MMKTSEKLRAAKALISTQKRWVKGSYLKDEKRCMAQAVRDGTHPDEVFQDARDHLEFALQRANVRHLHAPPFVHGNVTSFNDDEKTTHADVMEVFDDAIKVTEKIEDEKTVSR